MLTVGSLFSGIGAIDYGLQLAGFKTAFFVEKNADCQAVLQRHFPGVPIYDDVRTCMPGLVKAARPDVIAGGDPCVAHSQALGGKKPANPDMSGYFLSIVGRIRPRWVVRENVHARTVADFGAALALLGYGSITLGMEAHCITGQSRSRAVIVGGFGRSPEFVASLFPEFTSDQQHDQSRRYEKPSLPCLTTRPFRGGDSRDGYIFEGGELRVSDSVERERLAGLPDGWTGGFSFRKRCQMLGNSAVPEWFRFIGERILGGC